jgi:hypothetical protein
MSSHAIEHAERRLASSNGGAVTVDRAVLQKLVDLAKVAINQPAIQEFEQIRERAVTKAKAKQRQEENG